MGHSYHSPAYIHIMRSLFFCFSFLFFLVGNSWVGSLSITVPYMEFPRSLFAKLLSGQTLLSMPWSFLPPCWTSLMFQLYCLVFQSSFSKYFLFIIYSPQKSSFSQFHIFMPKKHLIGPSSFGTGSPLCFWQGGLRPGI